MIRYIRACFYLLVSSVILTSGIIHPVVHPASHIDVTREPEVRNFSLSNSSDDPISITSNEDFALQGWPGNGTEVNPYVIENQYITTTGVAITISHTTVHFEIRDCVIIGAEGVSDSGIVFYNVTNGVILDTIVKHHQEGIYVEDSPGTLLADNTAINNLRVGFVLLYSDSCTLTNNTATSNSHNGFSLMSSDWCTMTNNTLTDNGVVIYGLSFSHWFHEMSGNTVNDRPLGYFADLTNGVINASQYGQVILANCSGVTVKEGVFTDASVGIQVGFSSNCTLMSNIATSNEFGFSLWFSDSCTLTNNTSNSNSYGFHLPFSNSCTLANNTATSNWDGFSLWSSDSCIMTNNTATSNGLGFYLLSSDSCTLINNTAVSNFLGFHLADVEDCSLTGNTAVNNTDSGFYLRNSTRCILTENVATGNSKYGIHIHSGSNIKVYLNHIGYNERSNARDDSDLPNAWDDGVSSGNYWSDYSRTGVYIIPGDAGSVDNHPLTWDGLGPIPPTPQLWEMAVIVGLVATIVVLTVVAVRLEKKP